MLLQRPLGASYFPWRPDGILSSKMRHLPFKDQCLKEAYTPLTPNACFLSSSEFFVVFVIGSIDLSNNQSTHQCINRSIDLSIDRSIDLSIVHYVDISIYQSIDTSIDQSIDLSISRSIHQSIDLSLDRSIDLSIDQSIDLSIYQYIEQTLRRIGYTLKSVVLCRRMQAES